MDEEKRQEMNNEESKTEELVPVNAAEYQKTVEDLASFKDKYVRLLAEFENMRKRHERERAELIKYAHEEVVIEILGVVDDLDRSIQAAKVKAADSSTLLKGIEMIQTRLHELLKKYDVKPIECVGKPFDPNSHEVLMQAESDQHEDGTVLEEFQKGYTLGERVVRTAKVKVAKKKDNN